MCFHHNHKNDPNILKIYLLNKHCSIKTKLGKRSNSYLLSKVCFLNYVLENCLILIPIKIFGNLKLLDGSK